MIDLILATSRQRTSMALIRQYKCTSSFKPLKNMYAITYIMAMFLTCADQESFVRGDPTLTTYFLSLVVEGGGRGIKINVNQVIMGLPAKRYLNGFSLAGR